MGVQAVIIVFVANTMKACTVVLRYSLRFATMPKGDGARQLEENAMKTEAIQIIDCGRGPQLSTSRLTVMDVFYYLHRGYDFDFIHQAMPSLSQAEFDVVVDYVKTHHNEMVERDRRAEEFIRKGVEAQRARGGIFAEADENLTTEQRVARLKAKMQRQLSERNGARHSG
jgi:hypothetical protein